MRGTLLAIILTAQACVTGATVDRTTKKLDATLRSNHDGFRTCAPQDLALNHTLHYLLANLLTGDAMDTFVNVEDGNGLEVCFFYQVGIEHESFQRHMHCFSHIAFSGRGLATPTATARRCAFLSRWQ